MIGFSHGAGHRAGRKPAFDPASLALSLWQRPTNVVHGADGSLAGGIWSGSYSLGVSGAKAFVAITDVAGEGAAVNGWRPRTFDGATNMMQGGIIAGTLEPASAVLTVAAYSFAFYLKLSSPAAPAGDIRDNPQIIADESGKLGVAWSTSGVNAWHDDGSVQPTGWKACAADTWVRVEVTYDGSTLSAAVNGGSAATAAAGHVSSLAGTLCVGRNKDSVFTAMTLLEAFAAKSALSGADFTNLLAYANERYALSL